MIVLYVMIPVAILVVALSIRLFFWAVNSGQYDDLEGPRHSILFDDDDGHQAAVQELHQKSSEKSRDE